MSPAERQAQDAHSKITQQLIKALEELENSQKQQSPDKLAEKAFQSLGYDFPIVTPDELQALSSAFKDCLKGKSSWFGYQISRKFLENVVQGARGPLTLAPTSATAAAQQPVLTPSSDQQPAAPASGSEQQQSASADTAADALPLSANSQGSDPRSLRTAYQGLAAVVLLQLVQHLLAVPEQDAWQLIHGLSEDEEDAGPDLDPAQQDQMQMLENFLQQQRQQAAQQAPDAASRVTVYDASTSAQEDPDDFEFEPLEPLHPPLSATGRHGAGSGGAVANGAMAAHPEAVPYSWNKLHAAMMVLASNVQYSLLDDGSIWQDGSCANTLLQVVRTLGAHAQADALQPLLHAYSSLLVDHLVAHTAQIPILTQFWDALGIKTLLEMPRARPRPAKAGEAQSQAQQQQGLVPAEALLAFGVANSLAGQLAGGGSANARQLMWQQVNEQLLPLMVRVVEDLAAACKLPSAAASSSGGAGAAPALDPAAMAAQGAVCQLLVFYLQYRPGNADATQTLQERGVLAALSRLFLACCHVPAAEPLRQAVLCCAAANPAVQKWLLAVPGVQAAVTGGSFATGEPHELHGYVWELLLRSGTCDGAVALLQRCGDSPAGVLRLHAFLQLLATASACGGPARAASGGLWAPVMASALRQAQSALRNMSLSEPAAAPSSGGGAAVTANGSVAGADQHSNAQHACTASADGAQTSESRSDNGDAGAGDAAGGVAAGGEERDKTGVLSEEQLLARRAHQLQPACIKLLKTLLTTGSKTD